MSKLFAAFRGLVLGLGKLRDVLAGVLERDELASARSRSSKRRFQPRSPNGEQEILGGEPTEQNPAIISTFSKPGIAFCWSGPCGHAPGFRAFPAEHPGSKSKSHRDDNQ
jgi:hypothetical protein